jgi:hypothetical protein
MGTLAQSFERIAETAATLFFSPADGGRTVEKMTSFFGLGNYHCNFGFTKGWRGAIARTIMRRKLDAGPVDSLSRLKRAAEQRYTNSQV